MLTVDELLLVLPNPFETIKALDKYIIGQEEAKKTLALMLVDRAINRLVLEKVIDVDESLQKTNVLLIGPTGTGKTSLMKALEEVSNVPISINDITQCTGSGYIGGKVEDLLLNHLLHCDAKVAEAKLPEEWYTDNGTDHESYIVNTLENSIIYIDEIDKLFQTEFEDASKSIRLVQNELLKFLDGAIVQFDKRQLDRINRNQFTVNTAHINFVLGGAFVGLADIIAKRLKKTSGIGFTTEIHEKLLEGNDPELLLQEVTTEDLVAYGMRPELLGRVSSLGILRPLTEKGYADIILNSKNSIFKQYQSKFKLFGVSLEIEKRAIKRIVEEAIKLKLGARSLKKIFTRILEPQYMSVFQYKPQKIVITEATVKKAHK